MKLMVWTMVLQPAGSHLPIRKVHRRTCEVAQGLHLVLAADADLCVSAEAPQEDVVVFEEVQVISPPAEGSLESFKCKLHLMMCTLTRFNRKDTAW